jgi:hypothetical protein
VSPGRRRPPWLTARSGRVALAVGLDHHRRSSARASDPVRLVRCAGEQVPVVVVDAPEVDRYSALKQSAARKLASGPVARWGLINSSKNLLVVH